MKTRKIFIAHSWTDVGLNIQTKNVAKKLSEANEVLFITQARIGAVNIKVSDSLSVVEWPNKRPNTWNDLVFIIKQIIKKRPDVAIVHFGATNIFTFAAWLCRVKYRICWLHTLSEQYFLDASKKSAERGLRFRKFVYKLATHVVVQNEYAKLDAEKNYGIEPKKVVKIVNGISPVPNVSGIINWKDSIKKIRYIGRLDYSKGVDLLIDAFAKLANKYDKIVLEIVGKGIEEDALKSRAKKSGHSERIVFVGYFSNYEDARRFIGGAYVLVVPSRMDNLPTVVIEAMSINTPVIGARAGGIPYMINDQKDGILVQPESIEELTLALENIINDVEFRDTLAISAKEKFDLHFTMEGHVKNVVSFLNSLN